jgi:hypothetical protein
MTAEMKGALADPNKAIQIAIGDPMPTLIPQDPKIGLRFGGLYYKQPKRYVLKSGHMSRDDHRIFDAENGQLVYNSHHPGKVRATGEGTGLLAWDLFVIGGCRSSLTFRSSMLDLNRAR